MTILLVGYRGSGKSTVGRRLANELWYKFADTDAEVVKRAGNRTISEIFEKDGENAFRETEAQVVRDFCGLADHVVALGGGAILREDNRHAIKSSGHKVIYLRCDAETIQKRIQGDPETVRSRPPLTHLGGGIEEIRKLLAEREPLYREVASKELDVTNLSPEEAARYVVRLL
jgi:shikimate kinase